MCKLCARDQARQNDAGAQTPRARPGATLISWHAGLPQKGARRRRSGSEGGGEGGEAAAPATEIRGAGKRSAMNWITTSDSVIFALSAEGASGETLGPPYDREGTWTGGW